MTRPSLPRARTSCSSAQVPDRPPPLRLLPSDEGPGADATPPFLGSRALPRNLYLPAPTMKTLWCRFSIDGVVYRRSTGCRDVRNAERRAAAIRVELEAEARGIAGPKRVTLEDAIKDFGRHTRGRLQGHAEGPTPLPGHRGRRPVPCGRSG
jgi:hypothetical protein